MKDIGDHHSRAGDPARVERAQRLLATARLAPPPTTVTFAEIEAAIHARRWAGLPAPVRWLVGGAVALCPVLALGSLAVSHGWLTTTTTTTTVPARVTAPAGTTKTSRASRGGAPARRPDAAATAPSERNGAWEMGRNHISHSTGPQVRRPRRVTSVARMYTHSQAVLCNHKYDEIYPI